MASARGESTAIEAIDSNGCGLRLRFIRRTDRYSHTISLVTPQGESLWLTSADEDAGSGADAAWPPSPPFQQLSIETRGPRQHQVGLLIGMAGRSHWSASIEPGFDPIRLRFDLACRILEPPIWLGCRYRFTTPPLPVHGGANAVRRSAPPARRAVWPLAAIERQPAETASLQGGHCLLQLVDENEPWELQLGDYQASITTVTGTVWKPATVRWRYQMSFEASHE